MKRLPWFPQYASDRLADWQLRACSLAAQGVFFNLQLLAHAERGRLTFPGVLSLDGFVNELSRAIGKDSVIVAPALDELLAARVVSLDSGVLTVPCMVQESDRRELASLHGREGVERKRQRQLKLAKGNTVKGTLKGSRKGTHQLEQNTTEQNTTQSVGLTPDALLALYETESGGKLAPIRELSSSRRRKVQAAIRRHPKAEYWRTLIRKAASTPFCCGAGDRGWKFGFDALVSDDKHLALREGKYDDKSVAQAMVPAGRHVPSIADTQRMLKGGAA